MKRFNDWTNFGYPLPALVGAWVVSPASVAVLAVCWTWLAVGSYQGHRYETRLAWVADVTGMMAAIASLGAVAWAPMAGPIIYALAPAAPAVYLLTRSLRNVQVGVWAAVALAGIAVQAGWLAALPGGLFAVAVYLRLYRSTGEDIYHGFWHILSWLAGAVAVGLI